MRRGSMRPDNSERGAVLVEFALVLPLLVILIFGIIQVSIAFNRFQGIHAAAREGGRTASIPSSTAADVTARVNEALAGISFDSSPTINPGASCANRQGQQVTVTVSAPHTISVPFLPAVSVAMNGRGVFRCE